MDDIDDEGGKAMKEALKTNKTLIDLSLWGFERMEKLYIYRAKTNLSQSGNSFSFRTRVAIRAAWGIRKKYLSL